MRAVRRQILGWWCLGLVVTLVVLLPPTGRAQDRGGATNFFLPQNPVAAAYVLGRLSNTELVAAPRSEFVYVALLERKGLDKKYRLEALEGLTGLRHTTVPDELLKALARLDKKGPESESTLQDLAPLLLQRPPQELAATREALTNLISTSTLALTRQIGFAACVTADGSSERVWQEAKGEPDRMTDLIASVGLLPRVELRGEFYSRIEPVIQRSESAEVLRSALLALVAIPGHDSQSFQILSGLLQAGTERATVVAALARLPQSAWPQEGVGGVVTNLLQYLESVPTDDRATPAFTDALQFATEMGSTLPGSSGQAVLQALRGLGPTVVVLHAVYEQMRYDKPLVVVEPGKPVVIRFQNDDAMPHNLAILVPGAQEEIGRAAEKMSSEPDSQGRLYVPASPKLLYATKMIAPGQKGQLAFTAPSEAGDYPYICTFPGHWQRMSGILAVTGDPQGYLAQHAQASAQKITEWTLADLKPELAQAGQGRDLQNGKEFFSKLACVQCHRLGQQGYAFGPDLSDVFSRYQNDRANVLQQILEPSARIEDRYRNFNFELKDGDSVVGLVLKEGVDTVTIQAGPADSLIQTIKKADILQKRPQASSPMPVGLLNSLSKEQILDLLAYLESGGKVPVHHHAQ